MVNPRTRSLLQHEGWRVEAQGQASWRHLYCLGMCGMSACPSTVSGITALSHRRPIDQIADPGIMFAVGRFNPDDDLGAGDDDLSAGRRKRRRNVAAPGLGPAGATSSESHKAAKAPALGHGSQAPAAATTVAVSPGKSCGRDKDADTFGRDGAAKAKVPAAAAVAPGAGEPRSKRSKGSKRPKERRLPLAGALAAALVDKDATAGGGGMGGMGGSGGGGSGLGDKAGGKSAGAARGADSTCTGSASASASTNASTSISLPTLEEDGAAWGLDRRLVARLGANGITHFFPVQRQVVPEALAQSRRPAVLSRDVCVGAATGSGKTLVFVLAVLQALAGRGVARLRALVVLPSRHLALQVCARASVCVEGRGVRSLAGAGLTRRLLGHAWRPCPSL